MRLDIYIHFDPIQIGGLDEVKTTLDQIMAAVRVLQERIMDMTAELTTLQDQVTETLSVEQSAIILIQGLADQIAAIKDDPAAIQALADSLHAKSDELAAAVIANTPEVP